MAPVKILHIIGGGEIGGAEQHVLNLLPQLDRKRFTPLLACLVQGPLAGIGKENGLQTMAFSQRWSMDLTPLPSLIRQARQENVLLLHCHGSRANLLGRLAAKWLRLPSVSTFHSSLAHDYLSPRAAQAALWLDRLTLPLSSGQIVISRSLAPEVAARGGKNIRVIYNGQPQLPLWNPAEERAAWRQRWNISPQALVIGNIARLHPAKGPEQLVQAAKHLHQQFPHLHLLMIGDGPLRASLSAQLEKEGIPFTLPGFLPQAYRALPAFDLFVLPSLSEGMGLVFLEAMQAGIPLVASAVGGIPELIRDRQDGILVPPGKPEALVRACADVLSDPALAQSLTRSAFRRWPEFSIEKMVEQTQSFYDEILAGT